MIQVTRRRFLQSSLASTAVIAMSGQTLANTTKANDVNLGFISCGNRATQLMSEFVKLQGVNIFGLCDPDKNKLDKVGQRFPKAKKWQDLRGLLKDDSIDAVVVATCNHWHCLAAIWAMEAGKDVVCEKPMTRFVAEGRAVVEASRRTKRIFQVGTYGRFGASNGRNDMRKIVRAGLVNGREVRVVHRGGFKVRQWSGPVQIKPQPVPDYLDWNMYCGPSPLKPFHPPRFGGMHRGYWDYDGGGLGDMGQHALDPITYRMGKDETSPVEVTAHAPPAHPEVAGMWGWVRFKYEDGVELVLESGEWGEPHGLKAKNISREDLNEEERRTFDAIPDEEPLVGFGEAVKTRVLAGGHPEVAHRTVSLMHLANVAFRTGRSIKFDPKTERAIGDEEANRLIDQPMRAPWHL